MDTATALGQITFSPGGEEWIEYGAPQDRRRVGFHDYAAIYAVPGLYERVFYEELGMCSSEVVVGLYAEALRTLGRTGAAERVLDFGAGSGIGGEVLRREAGVGAVVGVDLEPVAAVATERDRPGIYDEFHVADLADAPELLATLEADGLTAVVAVSAIGEGHIPLELLTDVVQRLLRPDGLVAFAVADVLVPDFLDGFFARVDAERLATRDYVHRRSTDGTPHGATAIVARMR